MQNKKLKHLYTVISTKKKEMEQDFLETNRPRATISAIRARSVVSGVCLRLKKEEKRLPKIG